MEPEEHVVEQYYQHVRKCFTMTNVKFKNNKEADLLVFDPATKKYKHVEVRVTDFIEFLVRATKKKRGNFGDGLYYLTKSSILQR